MAAPESRAFLMTATEATPDADPLGTGPVAVFYANELYAEVAEAAHRRDQAEAEFGRLTSEVERLTSELERITAHRDKLAERNEFLLGRRDELLRERNELLERSSRLADENGELREQLAKKRR